MIAVNRRWSVREEQFDVTVMTWKGNAMPSVASITPTPINDYQGEWWVNRVNVNPRETKAGIGTAMLSILKAVAKIRDGTKLIVCPGGYGTDRSVLVAFYEKNGFVTVEDHGEAGFKMECEL